MKSPCNNVCTFDQELRLCTDCGRTLQEIDAWEYLTEYRQREIIKRLQNENRNISTEYK
jgi:hypothetical protein